MFIDKNSKVPLFIFIRNLSTEINTCRICTKVALLKKWKTCRNSQLLLSLISNKIFEREQALKIKYQWNFADIWQNSAALWDRYVDLTEHDILKKVISQNKRMVFDRKFIIIFNLRFLWTQCQKYFEYTSICVRVRRRQVNCISIKTHLVPIRSTSKKYLIGKKNRPNVT